MPDAGFPVLLIPADERFDEDDPMFLDEVGLLRRELRAAEVEVVEQPSSGGKGAELAVPIIQAVVAGGAGMGTIGFVIREWIKRRGTRSVRVEIEAGGKKSTYDVTAKNVTDETFMAGMREILDAAEES
ncbi:effector-associated constant component EACC1 [Nocardia sp. SSK8]|uniref:effector-associated constant component EACC1 n=1 Tax=Nocardia sp. SSK8 TaxID=3120154 RepID=UPI0030083481